MLKVIMILQALCGGPHGDSPDCQVKWAKFPDGDESVGITGYYKEHVVICRIKNTAEADCTAYRVEDEDEEEPEVVTGTRLAAK